MSSDVIFGGRTVAVKIPGCADAVSVSVRTLKINELPRYFDLLETDEELAAFLTGKDSAFIASLEPASVLDIVEAGHDLNFQTAQRWAERRARHIEALGLIARKVDPKALPNSARTAG